MSEAPVIIVTGASRGIGLEVARWLAGAGSRVAMLARSFDHLNPTAESIAPIGGDVYPIAVDITDYEGCETAVLMALERFGRLDGLVNNAGVVTPVSPLISVDARQWQKNIETNLVGAFNCLRASINELKTRKGRVINISSGAAELPLKNLSAYCTAKAALNHFSEVLSVEEPGLICMAVRPGMVDTDMQADIRDQGRAVMTTEQIEFYVGFKERGELQPPHIPAKSIAWLAIAAPARFNGGFYDADDPGIQSAADNYFGETNP